MNHDPDKNISGPSTDEGQFSEKNSEVSWLVTKAGSAIGFLREKTGLRKLPETSSETFTMDLDHTNVGYVPGWNESASDRNANNRNLKNLRQYENEDAPVSYKQKPSRKNEQISPPEVFRRKKSRSSRGWVYIIVLALGLGGALYVEKTQPAWFVKTMSAFNKINKIRKTKKKTPKRTQRSLKLVK